MFSAKYLVLTFILHNYLIRLFSQVSQPNLFILNYEIIIFAYVKINKQIYDFLSSFSIKDKQSYFIYEEAFFIFEWKTNFLMTQKWDE